jgi:hypothetical protein
MILCNLDTWWYILQRLSHRYENWQWMCYNIHTHIKSYLFLIGIGHFFPLAMIRTNSFRLYSESFCCIMKSTFIHMQLNDNVIWLQDFVTLWNCSLYISISLFCKIIHLDTSLFTNVYYKQFCLLIFHTFDGFSYSGWFCSGCIYQLKLCGGCVPFLCFF